MNRGSFAKVFRSLWDGTLAQQPEAWPVFVFLLAHADAEGVVEMTHAAIAARSGFAIDAVRRAIELLEAPDPDSRTPAQEGRRLVRLSESRSWGWRITNYPAYRTQSEAERAAAYRRRQNLTAGDRHAPSRGDTPRHHAEGEGEREVDKDTPASASPTPGLAATRTRARVTAHAEHPNFPDFYSAYPRQVARPAAEHAFRCALERHPEIEGGQLAAAARQFAADAASIETRFVPHPARWLDEDRFLETIEKARRAEARARTREVERRNRQEPAPPTEAEREYVQGLIGDLANNFRMDRTLRPAQNPRNGAADRPEIPRGSS